MTLWHPSGELASTEQTLLLGAAAADSKAGRVNLKSRCYSQTLGWPGRPNRRTKGHLKSTIKFPFSSKLRYHWTFCVNDAFASTQARNSSLWIIYFSETSESVNSLQNLTYRTCWVIFNGLLLSSSLCGTGLHVLYRSKKHDFVHLEMPLKSKTPSTHACMFLKYVKF